MRIVVGVDSTETSLQAARKAAGLAVAFDAELRVASAFEKFEREQVTIGSEVHEFTSEEDALAVASKVVAVLAQEFPDAQLTPVATVGKPGIALATLADSIGADLVVVGNKRVQGIARVLGSVARDASAHANCDVYVVNTHSK